MGRRQRRRILVGAGLGLGFTFGATASAQAAVDTFTVNSLADPGDGTCDTTCTLRDAILASQDGDTSDQDVIVFDSSITGSPGTITLTSGQLPTIDEPLYIDGPGASTLTVNANNATRIFETDNAGGVTVDGLTLTGGAANSISERGAAIYADNTSLVVSGSVVTGSSVTNGVGGGGIWAKAGSLSVQASTISQNSANGTDSEGGGILAAYLTSLSIADSEISGNTVSGSGVNGAGLEVYQSGVATIASSTIAGNTASGATAAFEGAGFLDDLASVTISDSTISGNHAEGGFAGLSIQSSPVTIENSTFTGNDVTGPYSSGGALNVANDSLTIRSSTIAGNDGGFENGGIYWGGPVAATIRNTIVAGNSANNAPDLAGTFGAAFSLIGSTSGAAVNTTVPDSNIFGQDPQLGALANNGGETMTMLPGSTSPVIDCGSDTTSTFDQRGVGFPRVVQQPNRTNSTAVGANGADLGAVEVAASPSITGACANNPPHRPVVVTPTGTPTPTATPTPTLTPTKKKCKKKKHKRSAQTAKKKCKKKKKK
jgi:CSLREA domain-containing protein